MKASPLFARCVALTSLVGLACQGPDVPTAADRVALVGADGATHRPLEPDPGRASVLFFLMVDCPIANAYAPEIQAISAAHQEDALDFYLVYVDPGATSGSTVEHAREYGHRGTLLLDADQALARHLGVSVTPEVAVVTAAGQVSYLGRIDDRYRDLARRRPTANHHDLRDHLRDLLEGRAVGEVRTQAVGCLLPELQASSPR